VSCAGTTSSSKYCPHGEQVFVFDGVNIPNKKNNWIS